MSDVRDVIEMLCDEPEELRRVFGGLGEFPAFWIAVWDCNGSPEYDWQLVRCSRAESERDCRDFFDDMGWSDHENWKVIPLTPAAVLHDRKAGL